MPASFGHLEGYGSGYDTYMRSLAIAKDLFRVFDRANLFDPAVAARYRDQVLAPGESKDDSDLGTDFLGRLYTFDASRVAGRVAGPAQTLGGPRHQAACRACHHETVCATASWCGVTGNGPKACSKAQLLEMKGCSHW